MSATPQTDSRRGPGGILAALADTTAAIAAYTVVPKGVEIATLELKINYLEPVPGGRVKADARVLRKGRNFIVAECEDFSNETGHTFGKGLDDLFSGRWQYPWESKAYSSPPLCGLSPSYRRT